MRADAGGAAIARVLALLLLFALGGFAGAAAAQEAPDPFLANVERTLDGAEATVEAGLLEADEIEALRERFLRLRGELVDFERSAQEPLTEARARLDQLGPAPEEGVEEPQDVSERRAALSAEVASAQVPVLEAQEVLERLEAVLDDIEQQVWTQLATELTTRAPSPLLPATWREAQASLGAALSRGRERLEAIFADPERRAQIQRQLPLKLALLAVGLAVALLLRRWLIDRVERALVQATSARSIAWLVAARNASLLILAVVAAGLIFAALDPDALRGRPGPIRFFVLPRFVLAAIGAAWLASSLFAPRLAAYRIVPVDDAEAARGARLVRALGLVLAAHLAIEGAALRWGIEPAVRAALSFPVIVLGGLALARLSALIRATTTQAAGAESGGDSFGLRLVALLGRALLLVAAAAPVLAAVGYIAAAERLMFPTILTFGLIGTGMVLFDLLLKTLRSLIGAPAAGQEGLAPVIIVVVLGLAAAPLLALIWGARQSDLATVWSVLRDGVSLGGIRISLGDVVSFALVFGLVFGLTRMLQSLLRSSVLPRTRMDAGGRNAILAGVGYVGFFVAALAAISSTGIDLSSIALVAGALSVGIGFGLQNVVSNFVSGIILLVERPIKEGDWIEVGGYSGYVSGISVRSTVIETFDRASVIVPNQDLVAGTVLNWTHSGMSGRLRVPISVGYDSDARRVEAILLEVASAHPTVLASPEPRVLFMDFGADALNFEIRCWLRDVNFTLTARSDMNFEILERFRAEGIEIPFPQRDLHVRGLDGLAQGLSGQGEAANPA